MHITSLRELTEQAREAGACEEELVKVRMYTSLTKALKDPCAPHWVCWYALNVIHGPWPPGEAVIATDPFWAYYYALNIIKGPWALGEEAIATSPCWAYHYTRDIIREPWEPGRRAIDNDPHWTIESGKLMLLRGKK